MDEPQVRTSLWKEISSVVFAAASIWILVYILLTLTSCNCYVTLIHTQGHAEDVVDDSGTASLAVPVSAM